MNPSKLYIPVKIDDRTYRLKTDYAEGEVNCYEDDIIELRITEKKSDETRFFIHFQFDDLNRAKQLFQEMTDVLQKLQKDSSVKVLLTCSSALTTSYFAEKLNESAVVLNENMRFKAVDINHLYQQGFDYDLVLLAPQVSYMYRVASQILKDKKVYRIPSNIFGMYDTGAMIRFVKEKLEGRKAPGEEEGIYIRKLKNRYKVLTIPVIMDDFNTIHMDSFVLDHGELLKKRETIKETILFADIEDIIRDMLHSEPDIQGIGISMPGIINDGTVTFLMIDMDHFEMKQKLEDEFHLPVFIDNDANCAALGYDSQQSSYRTILYHFQPRGSIDAGQGIVFNHHLHHGRYGVAGEVKYLMSDLQYSDDPAQLIWTPEGALEIVGKLLTASTAVIGEDLICIHCDMTPDAQAIRNELAKRFPENYLPEIRMIDNQEEYMAVGAALVCSQYMDQIE